MFSITHRKSNEKRAEKKDLILSLLYKLETVESHTKLMKMLFILDRTLNDRSVESPFNFTSYRYGPYDKCANDCITSFVDDGIVDVDNQNDTRFYELDEKERASTFYEDLSPSERSAVDDVCTAWGNAKTDVIVTYIYSCYPNFFE